MVSSKAVMGIEWTFMFLAYVFVACRLYVRLYMRGLRLYSADYWLIVGLMSCQGLLICDTLTYSMNAMDDFTITSVSLIPPTHPHMRIALYILTAVTGACTLVTFFGDTFWCGPDPSVNWRTSDDSCTVFSAMDLMRLNWSLNFITEVLNVVFPFPLIRDMSLRSRREKVALGVIFALGTITIAASVGRFITMLHVSNDISIYIWATAEICISICRCPCSASVSTKKAIRGGFHGHRQQSAVKIQHFLHESAKQAIYPDKGHQSVLGNWAQGQSEQRYGNGVWGAFDWE